MMPAPGIDLTIIAERHGHTRISTTLNIYTHVLHDSQAEAAELLLALLRSHKHTSS